VCLPPPWRRCFVPGPIPPGGNEAHRRAQSVAVGSSGFLQGAVLPNGDLDPCRWAAALAGLGRQDGAALSGCAAAEELQHEQWGWLRVREDAMERRREGAVEYGRRWIGRATHSARLGHKQCGGRTLLTTAIGRAARQSGGCGSITVVGHKRSSDEMVDITC
jgi:hypothetical protein